MRSSNAHRDADALQARLAARLAAALTEHGSRLPHDITERLRVARDSAVRRHQVSRQQRQTAAAPVLVAAGRGATTLLGGGEPVWWQRMASVVPLVVLLAGLLMIGQWDAREQVLAAADIDSVLLSDDLPPAAYTDPGFAEYLKLPQP